MSATYFETDRLGAGIVAQVASWLRVGRDKTRVVDASRTPLAHPAVASSSIAPARDVAAQLAAAQRRGREMERAFSHYVPPHVIERLIADPDGLRLGGETRDVTVLFADLRGFTALAEQLKDNPRRLTDLINTFLDPMTDIVLAHGGTIDKYMGDCIMAFWGAPTDDPDHARHAFGAAQAMLAAMDGVNLRLVEAFPDLAMPTVEIGIGINSGECLVGNLGSRRRFDYSVLGDPVNVASRLEDLCKTYNTPLLAGEETARRIGDQPGLIEVDRIAVRGRSAKVSVFGLASTWLELAA